MDIKKTVDPSKVSEEPEHLPSEEAVIDPNQAEQQNLEPKDKKVHPPATPPFDPENPAEKPA